MRILIFIGCLFLSFSVLGQALPGGGHSGTICKGNGAFCTIVPTAPTRLFDFTTQSLPNGFTFSRASAANYFNSSGFLASASVNTPRFDYGFPGSSTLQGLLIEGGATNLLLWNRDLTNVVWSQVTATVALDQTGIDNVSNSASSFTALGSNSTVCQTVTQAATNTVFSLYLIRISGSGNIAISQDGGTTYATVTLAGSWKRFEHTTQSTLNPTVCIRIATNGDKIGMDYAQLEATSINASSSPILTTNVQATRAGDSLSMPSTSPTGSTDAVNKWYNPGSGAFVAEWELPYDNKNVLNGPYGLGGLFSNPRMGVSINNGNIEVPTDGVACDNTGSHGAYFIYKTGATYGSKFFSSACNNVTSSISRNNLSSGGSFNVMSGTYVRKFTYWNYPLTTAQLKARTL